MLNLTALDDGVLPVLAGELAHAAFYAIVQSVDPALPSLPDVRLRDARMSRIV